MKTLSFRAGILWLAALGLCTSLTACAPTNFRLTTATTPQCTSAEVSEWNRVANQTQGVEGQDPVGFNIASFPAERFGSVVNNWHPLSGFKQTLCGELHHFNVYDGSGAEMDWNHFMIPAPEFEFLIADALPYKGGSGFWCKDDDWHSCRADNDCMEGELTPDETFYENPWFPKSVGDSVLEGRQICMYGAWVRECVHGHRPEIHPAELVWWKEQWGSADLYWLMTLQDDSNRFDTKDDFDIESAVPADWRPWGAAPMTARFKLAFEVAATGSVLDFQIGEAFAHNVVTASDAQARRDADNGVTHAIEFNDRIVLRADENQAEDNDLGVMFSNVCRRTNGTLQGYVTITTKTGVNNHGQEGYHVLFVTVNEQPGTIPPFEVPESEAEAVVVTRGDPASIRAQEVGGRLRLYGDLEVSIEALAGSPRPNVDIDTVERVSGYGGEKLTYERNPNGGGGLIKSLPLLSPAHLVFHMDSGVRIESTWPGLAVAALVDEKVLASDVLPPSNWPSIAKAAGGIQSKVETDLKLERVAQVQLSAITKFSMLRDGTVSLEEGSPFVEHLNEILTERDAEEFQRLFGGQEPVRVTWSVEAVNLATGEPVSVAQVESSQTATTGPETIQVTPVDSAVPGSTIQISFPRGTGEVVYEVRATATVSDAFGSSHTVEDRVWNQFLSNGTPQSTAEALLPVIAAEAGIASEQITAGAGLNIRSPDDPRLDDPDIRRSQMIYTFALQAADDGRITVDELASLISGAKLLRNQ